MVVTSSNPKSSIRPSDVTQHVLVASNGNLTRTTNSNGALVIDTNSNVEYNNVTITGNPGDDTDAATVEYVKNYTQGLDVKESVKCATTGNITLSGLMTVDGIVLLGGERVLVKNQTNANHNGVYLANSGSWTRSDDFDEPTEIRTI